MNYDIENNDCWIAGMEYLNKPPTPVTDYKLSSFVSTFGTPPSICLSSVVEFDGNGEAQHETFNKACPLINGLVLT